jgi:polyisoprenoid-binding protein YceI
MMAAPAALCFAAPALAAPTSANWQVNKPASHLAFVATVMNQRVNGQFHRWDAQIQFDPQALAQSRVTVTIDMASAATGDATRDQSLPTADWFNAAAMPRATFTASHFQSLGNDRYQAQGELTMRGVRRPAVLPFTLKINGNTAQMQGSLTLSRLDYGVGQGQWKGTDTVAANVQVNVVVTAVRGH